MYYRIIRPLLFTSKLGRKSMLGYADSGINFDHIYRNKAKGYTKLGILIDRILLNLPSAKATRHRKELVVRKIKDEVLTNYKNGRNTRIVDLASGPSRYLCEVITDKNKDSIEGLCLDIDKRSIEEGAKLAKGKPLLFRKANVLKLGHYKRLSEKTTWIPNLIICSGLYEYLNDIDVKKSLADIYSSLTQSGRLIFVTTMDNPNKKLIERLGKTKWGNPWVLFYRRPEQLKEWLATIGFKELYIEIDPWKMYVFCSGRKK